MERLGTVSPARVYPKLRAGILLWSSECGVEDGSGEENAAIWEVITNPFVTFLAGVIAGMILVLRLRKV